MSRVFVQLIKRVSEKEDVFTECLAAALREDAALRRQFVLKLCGREVDGVDVHGATIDVATQCGFAAKAGVPACCIDMVLTLDGATKIGIENKLFAGEGRDLQGAPDQLKNYLTQPLSRLAYVRAQDANVAEDVLQSPRYSKPAYRQHFLWSDFYEDVEACAQQDRLLTRALLELLKFYGFEPAKPEIGDLKDPDPVTAEANRRNFAKLWETTKAELSRMGWTRISPGSIAELYLDDGPSGRIKKAWVDPTWSRGLLRVRLTPQIGAEERVKEALHSATFPHHDDVEIQGGRAPGRVRDPEYVQVTISLRKLLGEATDAETMKRLLAEFVTQVFRAAG